MNVVYVTGNQNKADYFNTFVGMEVEHMPADTVEIQSLDLAEVVTTKAKEAYAQLQRPVLIEDTSMLLKSMGRLPGTFIKWFLEDLKLEGICRLADQDPERRAYASAFFAYYDGQEMKLFKGGMNGTIAQTPRGDTGFGWNPIFIPEGYDQTMGEMDAEAFETVYTTIKPFAAVREFLGTLALKG